MMFINSVWMLLVLLLSVPVAVLVIQSLLAFFYTRSSHPNPSAEFKKCSVAVIVPAHNEAVGIGHTLDCLMPQMTHGLDRVIVVADNCSDSTAQVAKSKGAIVLERFNQVEVGKGYALDYAMQHLKSDPPYIIMIVDADCYTSANLVDELARQCALLKRPVQCLDLMRAPEGASLKTRIAEFAWVVKNQVRPLGYKWLGLPCQLMGTGMAFLWDDLVNMSLATGHLVEDMKLGLDFTKLGKSPVFCEHANVISYFPTTNEGLTAQRTRWEHGHMSIILHDFPKLIITSLRTLNLKLFFQALDIAVPPLTLLFIIITTQWILSFILWLILGTSYTLILSSVILMLLFSGIFFAWLGFGTHIITLKELLKAPLVLIMKLPIYIKFFINRQVKWVRTTREND